MLDFKEFKRHTDALKEFQKADDKFYADMEKHFGAVELEYPRILADRFVDLLSAVMGDTTGAIPQFVYDSAWGSEAKGNELKTLKQLYDYLTSEKSE